MSSTLTDLRRKIGGAGDLESVVRTMKAVAASNISQYENSVRALKDYTRSVELGLSVCFRENGFAPQTQKKEKQTETKKIDILVFGSDQGLVGRFNDIIADETIKKIETLPGQPTLWAVGERLHTCLTSADLTPSGCFAVPNSIKAITPLVGQILLEIEQHDNPETIAELHLLYNRATSGAIFEPYYQQLLPLDESWHRRLIDLSWPTHHPPDIMGGHEATLRALIREYLFISLFKAMAESLAAENASRLAAMQRADKNIGELLDELRKNFSRVRHSRMDEELFDVIAGFEALKNPPHSFSRK
ncbi:MAG: F0F1 ATP synthase subunit gamma [Elusimicrobia bacterium RIFOXYB2_FULL_49_7]|nr:MAG: F0F1 ATP synthase subunit gamma [Elusimicrobia bacterium RIFOXYB2_FULL_49_7]